MGEVVVAVLLLLVLMALEHLVVLVGTERHLQFLAQALLMLAVEVAAGITLALRLPGVAEEVGQVQQI
jgi:hypothetical protein